MNNQNNEQNNQQPMNNGQNIQPNTQPTVEGQPQPFQQPINAAQPVSENVMPAAPQQEVMEDALSHTTQYSPFEAPVSEIKEEAQEENKSVLMFIVILAVIIGAFILFLPTIVKWF